MSIFKKKYMILLMKKLIIFAFSILLLSSCVTTGKAEKDCSLDFDSNQIPVLQWSEKSENLWTTDFEFQENNLYIHGAKIFLDVGSISFMAYPDEDVPTDRKAFFKGNKTVRFAKQNDLQIVFNCGPWTTPQGTSISQLLTDRRKLNGIWINGGESFSNPTDHYDSFAITIDSDSSYTASVFFGQTDVPENAIFVSGGFWIILKDGVIVPSNVSRNDSRLAIGISGDGKTITVLAVEGGENSRGNGLTFSQCAQILKNDGCTDAIQMDGGASTSLVIFGKETVRQKIKITQGSSLGFKFSR